MRRRWKSYPAFSPRQPRERKSGCHKKRRRGTQCYRTPLVLFGC